MLTLLMSLALSAATTEAPTAQPTTETAAKPDKKPKLVCRRIADTGSRLPERECRTQEDWHRQADSISQRLNKEK
jgi:hypothetical protein